MPWTRTSTEGATSELESRVTVPLTSPAEMGLKTTVTSRDSPGSTGESGRAATANGSSVRESCSVTAMAPMFDTGRGSTRRPLTGTSPKSTTSGPTGVPSTPRVWSLWQAERASRSAAAAVRRLRKGPLPVPIDRP